MTNERENLIIEKLKKAYIHFGVDETELEERVEEKMQDIFYESDEDVIIDGEKQTGKLLLIAVGSKGCEKELDGKLLPCETIYSISLFVGNKKDEYLLESNDCIIKDDDDILYGDIIREKTTLNDINELGIKFSTKVI